MDPRRLVHQRAAVLFEPARFTRQVVARLRDRFDRGIGLLHHGLDSADRLLAAPRVFQAFVQPVDLDVHVPDHLVETVGFDDRALDRMLLALERLGLLGDMLGERVEAGEFLLRRLAQLLELHQRAEFLLDLLDGLRGGDRILARFPGHVAQPGAVLVELTGGAAYLIELGSDRCGLLDGGLDVQLRVAQLLPQILERGALPLERFDAGAGLDRLRRQLLHRLPVILQLAVRREQLLGRPLCLRRRIEQHLDAHVDLRKRSDPFLEALDALIDLRNPPGGGVGLCVHLVERLAHLRQPRTAHRDLGQHRVERASFFFGGRDQGLEILGLFLRLTARQAFERIEHGRVLPAEC